MIIDFHTHAFPDFLAEKAIPVLEQKGGSAARGSGKVSDLLSKMSIDGVDIAVVHSIATKPKQEHSVNEFAKSMLQNKHLVPFGSVFPGSETFKEELKSLKEAGVKGVKLHPEYQQFYLDSPEALSVFDECQKLGLIVSFHAGEDIGYPPPIHAEPSRINNVVRMFPSLTFLAAHFGGYGIWEDVAQSLEAHDNLYLDTSMTATVAKLDTKTALRIISQHGVEHILLGSDMPWERESVSIEKVKSYGLSYDDTELILGKNAARLLKL